MLKSADLQNLISKIWFQVTVICFFLVALIGCSTQLPSLPIVEDESDLEVTATPTITPIPSPSFSDDIAARLVTADELPEPIDFDVDAPQIILDIGVVSGELQTLDPQLTDDIDALELASNLFPGLTRHNPLTNEVELHLAKGWRVSEDGMRWTFELRENIYWVKPVASAGLIPILPGDIGIARVEALRPVYAEDVVFAVRRACDPSTGTPDPIPLYLIAGCEAINSLSPSLTPDLTIVGVKALDPFTVEFELVAPSSAFLTVTSLPQMRALPVDVVTAAEEEFVDWTVPENGEVVSAGPFVLSPGSDYAEQFILEKNPFWPLDSIGNVTIVNLFMFTNGQDAYNRWNRRELDLVPIPRSLREEILQENAQKVMEVTSNSTFFLMFNHESEIFRIPELRRAFSAAIDREVIIEEVYGGLGYPAKHLTPPGAFGAPPEQSIGVGYNSDFARLSMAEGGVTACRFLPIMRFTVGSTDTSLFQAELIREMWEEELGCPEDKIRIEQVPFGELLAMTQPDADILRPDVWELGWDGFYPDSADWFSQIIYCRNGENTMRRRCSSLDNDILRAAVSAPDLRSDLYRNMELALFSENGTYPVAPIYGELEFYLRQTWLFLIPDTNLDQHNAMQRRYYDLFTINQELKEIEQQQ
ncbi:MAG: ABC transporter substrate-binding protein [Chloroflexota bacterium]